MDDTDTIVNKDEQYKVIDECMEEETPETAENSQIEVMACPDNATQEPNLEISTDARSNDTDKPVPMEIEHNKNNNSNNDNAIDFTADISLDQFNTQKEVTDEDVMRHLDVIESIELDPETFGSQPVEEIDQCSSQKQDKEEITIIREEIAEQKWYEKKIAEKDALFKERLSKLARVLTASYPHYEKWLERIEKIEGTPICKVDPIRRCSLNKPHANRWKFMCNEKQIQDSLKEENNAEPFFISKKNFKTLWCLEPMGAGGVNTNDISEFPSFVLHAVKIFEDFLQTTISSTQDTLLPIKKEEMDTDPRDAADTKQQWVSLLVRCNSKDELMLFASGRNISENAMNRLKQTYESGPGKNCNVKSLYCRSTNTCDNSVLTTFLVGVEALDEVVGNLKVQLVPKTNFWSNAAGAWNIVQAVTDLLKLTPKTTILEIGCGIGVIGLSIASKCREVIGVDSPLEINEAELTCQLNNISNASFIRGSSAEVVNKLNSMRNLYHKNGVTYCIVNTGTIMGRAIEVMTCLRKFNSLRRIVMITTLTKQSVRAILELARPAESGLGHPFMPVRACVVDTLPSGPHFEAVILMERRLMHRLTQPWFIEMLEEENKSLDSKALDKMINNDETETSDVQFRKNPLAKTELDKNFKPSFTKKKTPSVKSDSSSSPGKSKKLKRDHSPEIIEISKKMAKKFEKSEPKPWQQDVTAKKKNWLHENPALRINPLFDKKRETKEQIDLREKLSGNRVDTDLIQKVNESRKILEAAKEKLSEIKPTTVDATTAKEIKNVLSLVLDQSNKYHTQLPRSVWDRIAPPEIDPKAPVKKDLEDDPLLKGRFVQEIRTKDLVITTANKEYLETEEVKPKFKKYHNLRPLEPDNVMPVALKFLADDRPKMPKKSFDNRNKQQNQDNSWHMNKDFERNRWNNAESVRKAAPPMKRQEMPFRHRVLSPNRYSPKRPLLSPPRRPCSPPRRHFSPNRIHNSPPHREYSPQRRQMTPPRRSFSPLNREMSPPRRSTAVSSRSISPMRRQMSPLRPPLSPSRRQMSMMEYESLKRQMSPTYRSREMSPMRCQMSPERRPMSPVGRTMSPRSRDMIPPRHQSPMRRFSPPRVQTGRVASPTRRPQSPRRQSSPPNRFADEWDIPSRGAIEQSSTWQRSVNERLPENVWRNERQPTTSGNWPASSDNNRYHKLINQEKSWDIRDSSSHGNWGPKQPLAKPAMKESWQTSDNRWSGPSRSVSSGENWNRDKEILSGRKEPWKDTDKPRWEQPQSNNSNWNKGDKDDWNDLPEDARDPWSDESNLGLKERWMNFDNQAASSSSNWSREPDKGDSWAKSKDNWQNKSQAFPTKPSCQNIGNPNINEARWLPLNETNKKSLSTNWQGGANTGAWQPSNYNFQSQSQRPFMANLFKDRR